MRQKGTVILITFVIMGVLLLLGTYFLTSTLTESRISESQKVGTKTYYLAEAGINEAIWKLKNNETIKNNFLDGTFSNNEEIVNEDNVFGDDKASYSVTAISTAPAEASLTATSTYQIGNREAKRVIKTEVFRALSSLTEDSAVFTGGCSKNIKISYSKVKIVNGNLFSKNNLIINGSVVEVSDNPDTGGLEGQVLAYNQLNMTNSTVNVCEVKCASNECSKCSENTTGNGCPYSPSGSGCRPPDETGVPWVDFDIDTDYSFEARADRFYSASGFENLLWDAVTKGTTLTLNNITYVNGDINLRGGCNLVVNGVLVAYGDIIIGEDYDWNRGSDTYSGDSQIKITRPSDTSPSGLLALRRIKFGQYTSSPASTDIEGVIYAMGQITIEDLPDSFDVKGGIIGRKVWLTNLDQWCNITLSDDIIRYGLGHKIMIDDTPILIDPTFSPTIIVEHWEETY